MSKILSVFALVLLLASAVVFVLRPSTSEAANALSAGCPCGQCEVGCGCCAGDVCVCSDCACPLCE